MSLCAWAFIGSPSVGPPLAIDDVCLVLNDACTCPDVGGV